MSLSHVATPSKSLASTQYSVIVVRHLDTSIFSNLFNTSVDLGKLASQFRLQGGLQIPDFSSSKKVWTCEIVLEAFTSKAQHFIVPPVTE